MFADESNDMTHVRSYSIVPRVLQTIAWGPTRVLLAVFARFEVRGAEHLDGVTNAIFAVNHASELDPIVLTAALSPFSRFAPMFYVAAPLDNFTSNEFGWRRHIYGPLFFWSWGAYPVPRGMRDYARSLEDHTRLLQRGASLCMFPEGRRTPDGQLQSAHGGIAYLAHATGVTVVPVYIAGTYRLGIKSFLRRQHTITVTFGKPLTAAEVVPVLGEDPLAAYRTGAQLILSAMRQLLY